MSVMVEKGQPVSDHEIHIKYEDQEKINQFACFNAKLQEIKEELGARKKKLQNLTDACQDVEELELSEDSFPFQLGEVFVEMTAEQTNDMLATYKQKINDEVEEFNKKSAVIEGEMKELKKHLYAKFGTAINLEYD